jgi:hypothetical protein
MPYFEKILGNYSMYDCHMNIQITNYRITANIPQEKVCDIAAKRFEGRI